MLNPSDEQKNFGVATGIDAIVTPNNCSLTTEGTDLLIHRQWGIYAGVKNLAWGIVITVVIFWFYKAGGGQQLFAGGLLSTDSLAVLVFGGAFLAAGLYFLVLGLYQIVNSTTIRVNTNSVSTQHHPLPWRTKAFSSTEIKQVFVTSHEVGYLVGSGSMGGRTDKRYHYSVNLLMSDGKREALVRQLPKPDQAHFIEVQIEKQLGIEDMRVKDEFKI